MLTIFWQLQDFVARTGMDYIVLRVADERLARRLGWSKGILRWPMEETSMKQKVLEAVEHLPADATIEDVMERLYFLAKIEQGLDDADAGRVVPHDDVKKQFGL